MPLRGAPADGHNRPRWQQGSQAVANWRNIVAAAGLAGALSAPAMAATCESGMDEGALKLRQLQVELMVAALTCARHPTLDMSDHYNAFVRRFGDVLTRNASVLREHLRSERALDRFMTELANEASMRSLGQQDVCAQALPRFEEVLRLDGGGLQAYAERTVRTTACAAR